MPKKKDVDTRFSRFGTVSFTSLTKLNDFIDRLEQGKVSGTLCKRCGAVFFPPRADCYQCLGNDMEWFDISGPGKLLTYSKLEYAPTGFEKELPYTIALVDYGDYKVFGRLESTLSEDEIEVGMDMKVAVNQLPGGQLNYVFKKA